MGRGFLGAAGRVEMVTPWGEGQSVPEDQVEEALARGYSFETPEEHEERRLESTYGDDEGQAFLEGVARSVTFGGSDALVSALGDTEGLRERRNRNRWSAGAGELAGALAPVGAGAAASRLGRAVEQGVAKRLGGGFAARSAGRLVGGTAEGALMGAQEGVTRLAMTDEPITVEAIAREIGGGLYEGGRAGGIASVAAGAVGDALGAVAKRGAKAAEAAPSGSMFADVEAADVPTLMKLKATEETALAATRKVEGAQFAAEMGPFQARAKKTGVRVSVELRGLKAAAGDGGEKFKGIAAELRAAEKGIARVGGNMEALATKPASALDALQRYTQTLDGVVKAPAFGALTPRLQEAVRETLDDALKLKARAATFAEAATSARLARIQELLELAKVPGYADKIGERAGGVVARTVGRAIESVPVIGPVVDALAGDKIRGTIQAVVTGRAGEAAGRLMGPIAEVAGRFGRRAAVPAAVVGTRDPVRPSTRARVAAAVEELADIGDPMTGARRARAALAPLRMVAPRLADGLEAVATRRVEYLLEHLPRPLRQGAAILQEDEGGLSSAALETFARRLAGADDPLELVRQLARGDVAPETVDAVRVVWPETYRAVRSALLSSVAELRETLTYQQRIQLGIAFDAPIDTTQEPDYVAGVQDVHRGRARPGPRPMWRGSRAAPDPTPAQRAAGGAR